MTIFKLVLILIYHFCFFLFVCSQQWRFPSDEQNSEYVTTNAGLPVDNNRDSLTLGERGPTLLEVRKI
jgi:hypothetical protein